MDAHAKPVVRFVFRGEEVGDHARVFTLAPDRRAVLAIGSDVEDRAQLALQRERLQDQRLGARVVVADRQHAGFGLRAEQHLRGMR